MANLSSDDSSPSEEECMEDETELVTAVSQDDMQVYLPGNNDLQPEELDHDKTAYLILHTVSIHYSH